jgi:hypothetical protein
MTQFESKKYPSLKHFSKYPTAIFKALSSGVNAKEAGYLAIMGAIVLKYLVDRFAHGYLDILVH